MVEIEADLGFGDVVLGHPALLRCGGVEVAGDGFADGIEDGRIELDSNIVERSIRPLALNRKNALFAGSDGGAEHWAMVASLSAQCRPARHSLNQRLAACWVNKTGTVVGTMSGLLASEGWDRCCLFPSIRQKILANLLRNL
jgi:hypothetical protein